MVFLAAATTAPAKSSSAGTVFPISSSSWRDFKLASFISSHAKHAKVSWKKYTTLKSKEACLHGMKWVPYLEETEWLWIQGHCSLHSPTKNVLAQFVRRLKAVLVVHVFQHELVQFHPFFFVVRWTETEQKSFPFRYDEFVVTFVALIEKETENFWWES